MELQEHPKATVVKLDREVMPEDVELLQKTLLDALAAGTRNVVVDLEACSYITSMGISAIFHVKKRYNEKSGDLRLANANRLIRNLFEMTNLAKAIGLYDSVALAVNSFTPPSS